ncbi:hypothetical protein CsSME_00002115 [Camellia sinensis var. sinensis]
MELSDQQPDHNEKRKTKKKKNSEKWSTRISFSAVLPDEISGSFADSICLVKYSTDPFSDIRESILEIIRSAGVQDWKEMEDLVYCYIAVNPAEVHEFIEDAFLSLCVADILFVEQID